ncbi:MAG: hypothetical protein PHF86_10260 [Candidatus Nanoarchaeia archaeon]|jgi:hypothetical protein|nr:hypothetical protein [Candidatus Nanoarchaeia archaeon]
MNYSEQEMAALISEIETKFAEDLKKAENEHANLKKSEEASAKVEAQPAKEDKPLVKTEEECDLNDNDVAEIDKLYKSMSKKEAEVHYKSLQKALCIEDVIKKSEVEVKVDPKKVEEEKLIKAEVENLKKENEDLKKTTEKLATAMKTFLSTPPKQKAITSIQYIKKNESEEKTPEEVKIDVGKLNKEEIAKRLSEKVRSGKLEKADKETVLKYYEKKVSIDAIKHLL